jgi:hypothetical protein
MVIRFERSLGMEGTDMNTKCRRALASSFAVVAAAVLAMFIGVSSAYAWHVTDGLATVDNVKLNYVSVSDITVAPGSTIHIYLHWALAANTACPHCDEEIQLGFANQNPNTCVDGIINSVLTQGGAVSGHYRFHETAPTTPGSYFLAMAYDTNFGCNTNAWDSGTPNPQTQYFAHVTVT